MAFSGGRPPFLGTVLLADDHRFDLYSLVNYRWSGTYYDNINNNEP